MIVESPGFNHGEYVKRSGENIAYNYETPESVIDDWMDSDAHRKAILHSSFTDVGFGLYENGTSGLYWVQMFIAD